MKIHRFRITCFLAFSFALSCAAPLCAHAQLLSNERQVSYPARGFWNGFGLHSNIVECSNYSLENISLTMRLFRSDGTQAGQTGFTVLAKSSFHVILANFFSIANAYGMYQLETGSSLANSSLRCTTLIYRFAGAGATVPVAYSYAMPVMTPVSGETFGLFNSYNPVSTALPPAENYLSIGNPSGLPFSATVFLFDAAGVSLGSIPVQNLPPNARTDFALGHPSGSVVGSYRIVPVNGSQPYFAFVSVYARGTTDYVYAYPLYATKGSCSGEPLFVNTFGPSLNWVQIGNPTSGTVDYSFEIRNQLGQLLNSQNKQLAARSHEHFLMNSIIGNNNIGTLRATCAAGNLIVQGAVYGMNGPGNTVSWGYANQIRGLSVASGEGLAEPLNSFLNVFNWTRTSGVSGSGSAFVSQARTSPVAAGQAVAFAPFAGSTDVGLWSFMPRDAIGGALTQTVAGSQSMVSELLRVYGRSNGTIGYITHVPPTVISSAIPAIQISHFAGGFASPIGVANAADGTNRLFVIEQEGIVKIVAAAETVLPTPFLDIRERVLGGGERGLLGIAFHPSFESNGRFFVHYNNNSGAHVISEFGMTGNPNVANPASERILLTFSQPFGNHNGGQMNFGPDGFLYIAFGDGGGGGDPENHAQNRADLLGDIIRIDVNGALPYAIPPSNPFVGQPGIRPEIFAYGFRNPWRFSFDRLNGRLFAGDVGQSAMEEVDIVTSGANYGWRIMEGTNCFNPATNCPTAGLTLPIHSYGRNDGVTVIGGYVYRGNAANNLYGKYVFGDFGSSRIWALEEAPDGTWKRSEIGNTGGLISSFGEDESGELYVLDLGGDLLRLNPL